MTYRGEEEDIVNDMDNRGLLRTIKVPFDVKAIVMGAVGYLVFITGGWILDAVFEGIRGGTHVIARFFDQALMACGLDRGLFDIPLIGGEVRGIVVALFGNASRTLTGLEMVVIGVWFFLILAIFGGAICRIMALRMARDEGLSLGCALSFSVGSIRDYLAVPVFLGGAIFIFWCCNLLAGLVSSIPYVGPILMIILYPLTILSGIIILLIAVGGVLGLLLMIAAISTEKNGALDAISRAFSYIYSRPLQFFFYYFMVFLLASIIVLVGARAFPDIVAGSFNEGTIPGGDFESAFMAGHLQAVGHDFPDFAGHDFFPSIGLFLSWLFMTILLLVVLGYVVTYILGGTTSIYFALRREVDGTEDSEIYIEGAEDEDDFGLPPVTPPAPLPEVKAEEKAEVEVDVTVTTDEPAPEPEEKEEKEEKAEEGESGEEEKKE